MTNNVLAISPNSYSTKTEVLPLVEVGARGGQLDRADVTPGPVLTPFWRLSTRSLRHNKLERRRIFYLYMFIPHHVCACTSSSAMHLLQDSRQREVADVEIPQTVAIQFPHLSSLFSNLDDEFWSEEEGE